MEKKTFSLAEHPLVLMGITLQGGFLDAYTYIAHDGLFCTMHTGNMARFGISLADGNWTKALSYFIPILACILGSFTSAAVKAHAPKGQDWRRTALLLELLALVAVGFVPAGTANVAVATAVSYISGFQFCMFTKSPWGAHNTAVCTGNLRTIGQFLYAAISDRTGEAWSRLVLYTLIAFSFVLGAAAGVPLARQFGGFSSLFGAAIAGILFLSLVISDKKKAN